eukprot:7122813-Alexandrium_andersonii.AAC.1
MRRLGESGGRLPGHRIHCRWPRGPRGVRAPLLEPHTPPSTDHSPATHGRNAARGFRHHGAVSPRPRRLR